MGRYRCEFYIDMASMRNEWLHTYIPSIEDVQNGFWVNDDFHFTKGGDGRFWIPQNCIRYVMKEGKL